MKVLIAAGGTGGHLYPGIAIAREVLRDPGSEVLFVGTARGIEARVLPREGLPVQFVVAGKLKGMGPLAIVKTLCALPAGVLQAMGLLLRYRPDVVIGVGGYASGPVGLAARLLGRRLVIVEPNSYAGLANRILGKIANRVILCFPGSAAQRFFPQGKTLQLGPLVRQDLVAGDRGTAREAFHLDRERFTLFVMGGSGGAHAINQTMEETAQLMKGLDVQVLHQTGERDQDEVAAAYERAGVRATVLPFIHDMAGAYAAADLVIARSGATTVAELAVVGKQAILIPFPFAADNHQEHNARTLAQGGRAEVIVQKDLRPDALAALIRRRREGTPETAGAAPLPGNAAAAIARIVRDDVQAH